MEAFLLDNVAWLLTAALAAAGVVWTTMRAGGARLSPQKAILAVSRGGGVFLDVRPPAEFSASHIPRAQNVPWEQFASALSSLAKFKDKPVVVVCPNGMLAGKAMAQLAKGGFSRVHVLAGGIAGWRDANLPLFGKGGKPK